MVAVFDGAAEEGYISSDAISSSSSRAADDSEDDRVSSIRLRGDTPRGSYRHERRCTSRRSSSSSSSDSQPVGEGQQVDRDDDDDSYYSHEMRKFQELLEKAKTSVEGIGSSGPSSVISAAYQCHPSPQLFLDKTSSSSQVAQAAPPYSPQGLVVVVVAGEEGAAAAVVEESKPDSTTRGGFLYRFIKRSFILVVTFTLLAATLWIAYVLQPRKTPKPLGALPPLLTQ